jgi:hypothetical protein
MSKKIVITESQLKKIVKEEEEISFERMMKNFNDEKQREVSMSREDARMLTNFALRWCEGKDNLPDCQYVRKLHSKHQLFM